VPTLARTVLAIQYSFKLKKLPVRSFYRRLQLAGRLVYLSYIISSHIFIVFRKWIKSIHDDMPEKLPKFLPHKKPLAESSFLFALYVMRCVPCA